MPGLHDLLVETHQLGIEYKVTFLSRGEISDATVSMIERELDEHLARALETRGLMVLQIEKENVVVDQVQNGARR